MYFIGIFANNLEYEIIKKHVKKMVKRKDLEIININSRNITNMKNIVFETIVLTCELNLTEEKQEILNKICSNCKYVIINADIDINIKFKSKNLINYITYGVNPKSTITISSIQDEKAIIYVQRNIKNIDEKEIEMGEVSIDLQDYKHKEIEILLAIASIYLIYMP